MQIIIKGKALNNNGYSVILALFMIGFLLVLTIGTLNLVLREMKDNRGMGDYLRAYAGAEGAQEMALLEIKKNGYGFYDKIDHNKNNRSIVLSNNPLDISLFKGRKDVFISYEIQSKVNSYLGELEELGYSIIPLFYIDDSGTFGAKKISLTLSSGNSNDLVWNIIGGISGISGTGSFNYSTIGPEKRISGNSLSLSQISTEDFLLDSNNNSSYLVLFNSSSSNKIKYTLSGINPTDFFTKPESVIISSSEVGGYKQNLKTLLNNTKYLNILKYSIFSNK